MLGKLVLLSLGIVAPAFGHGGGMYYEISGVNYTGTWETVRDYTKGSIQRVWSWDALDYDNPNISCGDPGTPFNVSHHAPTKAGETIAITYDRWPHTHGPMLAYLAACPDAGCEKVDLKHRIWFKIWEAGLLSGNLVDGEWAIKAVASDSMSQLKLPIPAFIKPGKYLLKHDMANLDGGIVQMFPNCVQLDISGEGASSPTVDELVAFPEEYIKAAGPSGSWPAHGQGSEWLYIDHANDTSYPMPGPPVWAG